MTAAIDRMISVLADLVPSEAGRSTAWSVPTEWFRWLDADAVRLFAPLAMTPLEGEVPPLASAAGFGDERSVPIDQRLGSRLASVDQLRPERNSVRVGWLFVAGRTDDENGRTRRVFHPLVTVPVKVNTALGFGSARVVPVGDAEITELVTDRGVRFELESRLQFGGGSLENLRSETIPSALLARLPSLRRFGDDAARAAGFGGSPLVPVGADPDRLMRSDGLSIVAGVGLYVVHPTTAAGRAGSLHEWAAQRVKVRTAFHEVYADPGDAPTQTLPAGENDSAATLERSPYVLSPQQREAMVHARTAPVTVISGAPGTGKSHTVTAIACDALARHESVLVAAKNDATVDALLDLLQRSPGPDPVVFGSDERRLALAERLAAGQLRPTSDHEVERARHEVDEAEAVARRRRRDLADRLTAIGWAHEGAPVGSQTPDVRFGSDVDLDEIDRLVGEARRAGDGWWGRWRRRRRLRAAARRAGTARGATPDELAEAARIARVERLAVDLDVTTDDPVGQDAWRELERAQSRARDALGHYLAAESRSDRRLNRRTLPALAALSTALRSGRAARRSQLARLDARLTEAVPLWVGSLPDIDDLLPTVPAIFDVVILDEASAIDQPLAATALLRARRCVVVGDPRQLRHVSFLSGEQMAEALERHEIDASSLSASTLDVRRNSIFDVAAGVSPVITLDEHFRCDPHLIDFVADRLYGGDLRVSTRRPSTDSRRCIDVVHLDGRRDDAKVVRAEVDEVIALTRRLRDGGASSVGIVSPFRAQADAIEEAALDVFSLADIEALDLRIGTVHEFQGNERDHVIASIGVGPDETANSWRFVEDRHLFAVFATRARRSMTLLVSSAPPSGGLLADYLAHAERPPRAPAPHPVEGWVAELARELERAGIDSSVGYPTGRHVVDISVATPDRDVALVCGVHADGADAHIERRLVLTRHAWDPIDVTRLRWNHDPAQVVVEILHDLAL